MSRTGQEDGSGDDGSDLRLATLMEGLLHAACCMLRGAGAGAS